MKKTFYSPSELQARSEKAGIKLHNGIYREAVENGMSLSAYLESKDPSTGEDGLDAFERQLALAGIRTVSDEKRGIFADKVDRFYASDSPVSSILFPEFLNREMRIAKMAKDVTGELVAVRTPIDADVYRAIYLSTDDVTKFRMKRVGQGAEIPTAKLETSEKAIDLKKYGLRIKASYEAVRRMRIDQLRIHLNMVALQTNIDKAAAAVDVIINGDGNSNGATNYNVNTLDSTASGKLTFKAWVSFLMKFNPYQCTTIVGNEASLLAILTMQFPNVDPLMLLAMYGGGAQQMRVQLSQDLFTNVRLVLVPSTPADVIVGIDKGFGIEEVNEIGATLTETDKIISSQFNEIVLSEVTGFAKLYAGACKTLTLGA